MTSTVPVSAVLATVHSVQSCAPQCANGARSRSWATMWNEQVLGFRLASGIDTCSMPANEFAEFMPGTGGGLGVDTSQVEADGTAGDEQLAADLRVAHPADYEGGNLPFSFREEIENCGRRH